MTIWTQHKDWSKDTRISIGISQLSGCSQIPVRISAAYLLCHANFLKFCWCICFEVFSHSHKNSSLWSFVCPPSKRCTILNQTLCWSHYCKPLLSVCERWCVGAFSTFEKRISFLYLKHGRIVHFVILTSHYISNQL